MGTPSTIGSATTSHVDGPRGLLTTIRYTPRFRLWELTCDLNSIVDSHHKLSILLLTEPLRLVPNLLPI